MYEHAIVRLKSGAEKVLEDLRAMRDVPQDSYGKETAKELRAMRRDYLAAAKALAGKDRK